MKTYNTAVVGIGAVGREMVRLLRSRNFPVSKLTILARSDRTEVIDGEEYEVRASSPEAFEGVDFAFFAGTEGSKGASAELGWAAVERGCVVIDNGNDFRMDPRVPLVVPEVNAQALKGHSGFIANPNCSTIIALTALGPLHAAAGLRRFVASTYQAVSGSGSAAITELEEQVRAWVRGETPAASESPHQIAFNVLPQIGGAKGDNPGVTSEELKMEQESHKILGDESIRIFATCARVPVFNGHSESINAEFKRPLSVDEAREILNNAPGVRVVDDLDHAAYPMPLDASGEADVLVGRLRIDTSVENGLALWVVGDNLWKGAALNAVQIAETLIAGH
jgi:aspartate-semialdehyde dehydrogenase